MCEDLLGFPMAALHAMAGEETQYKRTGVNPEFESNPELYLAISDLVQQYLGGIVKSSEVFRPKSGLNIRPADGIKATV